MASEKLYNPLEFYLHDPREEERNGEYGMYDLHDERYRISHKEAWTHMEAIELAIRRDRDNMDKREGMAEYLDEPLVSKVKAMFPSIELTGNGLFCVTEVTLSEPLTPKEMTELKEWWSGQLSDGWGEGFEQRAIKVDGDELYVVPWTSDDSFFIDTEREFSRRFAPDISIQKNIETEFLENEGDAYALYLYEEKRSANTFNKDNYRCFETGVLNAGDTLDTILGNTGILPSDIIVMKQNGEFMPWYVDLMAFSKLPEFYNGIEGIQIGTPITPAEAALFEPDVSINGKADEMRTRLVNNVNANYIEYIDGLRGIDGESITDYSAEIATVSEAHYYITQSHNFHFSELDYLLQFKNPLKVVAEAFDENRDEEHSGIMWKIFHEQDASKNGRHILISNTEKEAADIPVSLPDTTGKGYIIATADDSDFYIANALHIERNDSIMMFESDEDAAQAAKKDGVPLINGMDGVPDDVYFDSPENREIISMHLEILEEVREVDNADTTFKEIRQQLNERAKQNWDDYRNAPHNTTPDDLFNMSVKVVSRRDAYMYIKDYDGFTAEQINCLLQFANPVELVADYLDPKSEIEEMEGILANILEEQESFKKHYTLAKDSAAPAFEELEQKLRDRLADNLAVYKRDTLDLSKEELYNEASEIAVVNEIYYYMMEEHNFTESEITFLLNFQNPLEVLSDKSETQLHDVRETVLWVIGEKDRILQSGAYELITDESDPALAAPDRKRDTVDIGEKPSVLERIRQHTQEQRERPPTQKDKVGHKKTDPEL